MKKILVVLFSLVCVSAFAADKSDTLISKYSAICADSFSYFSQGFEDKMLGRDNRKEIAHKNQKGSDDSLNASVFMYSQGQQMVKSHASMIKNTKFQNKVKSECFYSTIGLHFLDFFAGKQSMYTEKDIAKARMSAIGWSVAYGTDKDPKKYEKSLEPTISKLPVDKQTALASYRKGVSDGMAAKSKYDLVFTPSKKQHFDTIMSIYMYR